MTQKQKESSQALAEVNKQLESVRTELADSKSLSESLKQDLEQVSHCEKENNKLQKGESNGGGRICLQYK